MARLRIRSGVSGPGHQELLEEPPPVRLIQQGEVKRPKATGLDEQSELAGQLHLRETFKASTLFSIAFVLCITCIVHLLHI